MNPGFEETEGRREMNYGLSTTMSGVDCYLDRLPAFKRAGIAYLELCLREDYEMEASLYADCMEAIRRAGMTVFSVHLPFGHSVTPACAEEEQRLAHMGAVKRFIDLTESSGARVYVIHGSHEPVGEGERPLLLERAAKSLRELVEYMQPLGRILALENLPRTCLGNTPAEIRWLLGRVPGLRLCFDTNHFTALAPDTRLRWLQRLCPSLRARRNSALADGVQYAREFAPQIASVHISDYDGIDECHWMPGQGIVDFAGIHNALSWAGFDAPILFEPNERCKGWKTTASRLIRGYEKAAGLLEEKR